VNQKIILTAVIVLVVGAVFILDACGITPLREVGTAEDYKLVGGPAVLLKATALFASAVAILNIWGKEHD
jgi:hypothetical protein